MAVEQVFPPRDGWDVAAYDHDEVVRGYMEYSPDDPHPGDNHPPAYRWGWTNHLRDSQHDDDGFDRIRWSYLRLRAPGAVSVTGEG